MTLESRRFFARNPVFTTAQYKRAFPHLASTTARNRLIRAVEESQLKRIRKGLYAVVPADVAPENFKADRFLVLTAMRRDAVFCGHSALELLGIAQSTWTTCTAYSSGWREPFTAEGIKFRPLPVPTALASGDNGSLGVAPIDRAGTIVKCLTIERVLVEGFKSPIHYGGPEEFLASVKGTLSLDAQRLIAILQAFGEKRLYSCVGWFLDNYATNYRPSERLLDELLRGKTNAPTRLFKRSKRAILDKNWQVYVPVYLASETNTNAAEF